MKLPARYLPLLTFVGAFATSSSAFARPLDYHAAEGCPTTADVQRKLDDSAPEGRPAKFVVVREGESFRGDVTIGDGEHAVRRALHGATCEGVVDAMALVAKLDKPEPTEAPPPPKDEWNTSDKPIDVDSADRPHKRKTPPDPPRNPGEVVWEIAVGGQLSYSLIPAREAAKPDLTGEFPDTWVTTTSLVGEVSARNAFGWTGFHPSASLALGTGRLGGYSGIPVSTSLELCPAGWSFVPAFRLSACVRGDIAAVEYASLHRLPLPYMAFGPTIHARGVFAHVGSIGFFADVGFGLLTRIKTTNERSAPITQDSIPLRQNPIATSVALGIVFQ